MSYVNYRDGLNPRGLNYLYQLVRYRGLSANLIGADLRARFRRSRLGILWAVLQPMGFAIALALVWGALFQQDFLAYSIYVMSGLIVWEHFTNCVIGSQDSLIGADGYLKQARIPLIVFQMRQPLAGFVTLMAGIVGLLILQAALNQLPPMGWHLLQVPVFFILLMAFLMPTAIIFSLLGTKYRDLRHATQVMVNALFFLSPVMLSREYLDNERLAFLQYVNPMMPLLDLFRKPLLNGEYWTPHEVLLLGGWIAGVWVIALILANIFGRRVVFAI